MGHQASLMAMAALLAACTTPNPLFVDQIDGSPGEDARPPDSGAIDGHTGEDLLFGDALDGHDVALPPDLTPVFCSRDEECDDKLSCTRDACADGRCANELTVGACLIGGVCYAKGEEDLRQPCVVCRPAASTSRWTPKADGAACATDGVGCTADICVQGQCEHQLAQAWCLIDGVCFPAGTTKDDGCRICKPSSSPSTWTVQPDGEPCTHDGKECTEDLCKNGQCAHAVVSGCLINGECFDDEEPLAQCTECVNAISTTAPTFVAGKPCSTGGLAAMCVANACRDFTESSFDAPVPPGQLSATSLRAVAYVPGANGAFWAAGYYERADMEAPGGVLLRLGNAVDVMLGPQRFVDLHHRVAIAEGGLVYVHDGTSWVERPQLAAQLSGQRLAVWGAPLAGGETVYLAGAAKPPLSVGMYRCELLFSHFLCASNFIGFKDGTVLGGVSASVAGGVRGPAWAINVVGAADIYYNDGYSLAWSHAVSGGCQDMGPTGKTPCSGDHGGLRAIHATSSDDVWVLGAKDTVLHYDGSSWIRRPGPALLGQYEADAIFNSAVDELVTVTAFRDVATGRRVALFNYNRKLDRWYGPILVRLFPGTGSEARLFDIAGESFTGLWIVGQARRSTSSNARLRGWALNMQ